MKPVARLHCVPQRSRVLVCATLVGAVATFALIANLPLPWWGHASAAAICLALAGSSLYVLSWCVPASLRVGADRRVALTDAAGASRTGDVLDASYVSGAFTALVWKPDGAKLARVCPIGPDSLAAEERRQLRVLLRYGRAPVVSSRENGVFARVMRVEIPP